MDKLKFCCKFDGVSAMVNFPPRVVFDEAVSLIASKFRISHENRSRVVLKYSMRTVGIENCYLENAEDLGNMFSLAIDCEIKVVEVLVTLSKLTNDVSMGSSCGESSNLLTIMPNLNESASSGVVNFDKGTRGSGLLSQFWAYLIKGEGQLFVGGPEVFKRNLILYASEMGFCFEFGKNNKERVTACCKLKDECSCKWFIKATYSKLKEGFVISDFVSVHTCRYTLTRVPRTERLECNILAEVIKDKVRDAEQTTRTKEVKYILKHDYGIGRTYPQCRRILIQANALVFGSEYESYSQLSWYLRAARGLNPGSRIILDIDEGTSRFNRVFVAWGSCIQGYRYIRPMIFLDGTFLNGTYKGVLLAATAKTGNDEIFPLGYAIVSSETNENWLWFLYQLREIVDYRERPISFFSDRGSGLVQGVPIVFPNCSHYYCLNHLVENLKKKLGAGKYKGYRKHMVTLFYRCAFAATLHEYGKAMDEFKKEGGHAVNEFLSGIDVKHWANAFSLGSRYGETTSNAAESFNSAIKDMKSLAIVQLIDSIRARIMKWFNDRSTKSAMWTGHLTKHYQEKFDNYIDVSRGWEVRRSCAGVFEVLSSPTNLVDFEKKSCTCCIWQMEGFPCEHAVATMYAENLSIEPLVERYWLSDIYRKSYMIPIVPVPTSQRYAYSLPQDPLIIPPNVKIQAGRRKKNRFQSILEPESGHKRRRMKCSNCGVEGHNKASCRYPPK